MENLWSLGGLSWPELLKRTWHESWEDEVFGQAARLSFYHFLAIFPVLLLLMMLLSKAAITGSQLQDALLDTFRQILPGQASGLVMRRIAEIEAAGGLAASTPLAILGAAWAALNGTWAVIVGLNTAYEVEEERGFGTLAATVVGLTFALALMGLIALAAMFYGNNAGQLLGRHFGFETQNVIFWRCIQWPVVVLLLLFAFALFYRFAPNLSDRRWQWSTPGAVVAVVLWLGSTLVFRFYHEHFGSYRYIYGSLSGAASLLGWLYFTSASVLIGGELNSEIEKAGAEAGRSDVRRPKKTRNTRTAEAR